MNYFNELCKVIKYKWKIILVTTAIIWYFLPLIYAVLYALYLIVTTITLDGIIIFIEKGLQALVPRLADVILSPLKEAISFLVIFLVLLHFYWLRDKISKNKN